MKTNETIQAFFEFLNENKAVKEAVMQGVEVFCTMRIARAKKEAGIGDPDENFWTYLEAFKDFMGSDYVSRIFELSQLWFVEINGYERPDTEELMKALYMLEHPEQIEGMIQLGQGSAYYMKGESK